MTIEVSPPAVQTLEDVRCADWVADGLCTTEPLGMRCLCRRACEALAKLAPQTHLSAEDSARHSEL